MTSDWHLYNVEELIRSGRLAIGDGYRAKNVELARTGIPFARVSNVDDGFDFAEADLFPLDGLYKVGEKISRPGDVVLTSKGTVGRFAFVQEETPRFVYSPQLSYWRSLDFETIDPRFLYYWIQGDEFREQADGLKSQTDMADYVSLSDQRRMTISLPSIDEQRFVSRILFSLDSKIQVNRHMNHTLQSVIQALFKSWFIDFDPVVARSESCQPYGISAEASALFPCEFEDTGFGAIPKGWKLGTIGDIGENIRRGVSPRDLAPDTPYFGLEHMPRRSITLSEWGKAGAVSSNKFRFEKGEILFGKLRPYFHKVGIAPVNGVCSTDILVLRHQRSLHFGLLLGYVSSADFINYVDGASEGTKMPRTSWETMARYEIVIPDDAIAELFTTTIRPMVERIHVNVFESRLLASIRDALIPRLLSGETL